MEPWKLRKKPVEIEGMQWDGTYEGATPIIDWVRSNGGTARYVDYDPRLDDSYIAVGTLDATARVYADDWVLRGVQGEFYPCKPYILAETYDPVPSDG